MEVQKANDKTIFGFWVYLMTDLVMFAVLFATFAVLRGNTFGGPTGTELFDMRVALIETFILLTSSFTCGLAMIAAYRQKSTQAIAWFAVTFLLGLAFLVIELNEFAKFAAEGNSWMRSGFLSSYFALVGTHGLHIALGLLWMVVGIIQIRLRGLSSFVVSKLTRFSLFWHFLDVVWIFIFTIVYLLAHV